MRLKNLKHGDVIECYRDFDCFTSKDKHETGAFIVIKANDSEVQAVKGHFSDEISENDLAEFDGLVFEKDYVNLFNDVYFTFSSEDLVVVPVDFEISYLGCLTQDQKNIMYQKTISIKNNQLLTDVNQTHYPKQLSLRVGDVVKKNDTNFCIVKVHDDNRIDIAPYTVFSDDALHFDFRSVKTVTYDDSYKLMKYQAKEISRYNGIVKGSVRKRQK